MSQNVLELMRLLAKLKRRLRRELSRECYEEVLKIIQEFEAWIEEQLVSQDN